MSKKIYGGLAIQNAQEIGFFDADSSASAQIKAPAVISASYSLVLPTALGTNGQGLKIDGSGNLSFVDFLENGLSDGNVLIGSAGNLAVAVDSAAVGDVDADSVAGLVIKAGVIDNANIDAAAAIELSKLEALTASRAVVSDGSGEIAVSAVTAIELGYVGGVTSAIQTQINNLSSTIQNFEWQASALDYVVDNTAVPASEVSGDRYILSHDGGAPHANYDGASAGDIVEFDGALWVATTPTAGTFIAADDEPSGLYLFGGASYSFKSFEATTASTGLTKVGFDVRLDATSAGDGLAFAAGVLSVGVDDSTVELNADALRLKDGGILDAKIGAAAAIQFSKMENLTANRALFSDASGDVAVSLVTDTELGYLDGVTSAIQTQFSGKAGTALDNLSVGSLAAESLLVGSSSSAVAALAAGSDGQVLKVVAGSIAWAADEGSSTFAADWVTGDTATKAVSHSLASTDVVVQVFDKADGSSIEVDTVVRTDANTVTLTSSQAPGASGWRVLIIAL